MFLVIMGLLALAVVAILSYIMYGAGQIALLVINLLAILALIVVMVVYRRQSKPLRLTAWLQRPQVYWSLFVIVVVIGVATRVIEFWTVPNGLNADEVSMVFDAYSLYHYGIDRAGVSWPVYLIAWGSGQSALLTYLTIPWVAVFAPMFLQRVL